MAVTLGGLGDRRFSIPDRFGRLFDRRVGEIELVERLGDNDLCPCGSMKRFKNCCRNSGRF
jgi:SEC-C motif